MGKKRDVGNKVAAKERVVTIISAKEEKDMEEGKQSAKAYMPNLPKPLTIEEKKYLLAVERGDGSTVRKMLQKSHRHPGYINKDCVDPLGRGALHMSIDNENLEMVELLVVMGVETKDALLHAIDAEFVEAVEVLLEHEEVIHKEGEPYSWEKVDRQIASFTPEITPLILAAHRNNYEILKILLDRGAMLPMPHDIRCGCTECIESSAEDSLRHSMSRINSYRALASPSLIALSSTDPILTAFELSWELKNLAYDEHEFRSEYLELRRKCRDFAEQLLSHTRSSKELAVILNYDPESPPYEDGEHMKLQRLELAIDYKQKKFVAHPNVQQLLAAIWYEGLPGFRRKTTFQKLLEIVKLVVLFPFYCMHYMVMPESRTGKLMRTPFMKFLIHSSSYLFFLLLLILVSVRFEELVVYFLGTETMRNRLQENSKRQRGNLPTPTEFFVFLYVFGFLWEETIEMQNDGIKKYLRNMWNIIDISRDGLYISTIFLRLGAYVQQRMEVSQDSQTAYIPREKWDAFDPQLISEGLFSAANILSALKLVHIFSINPYLGPLQISLGRMVIDIVKFFFIYSLVLFAFACATVKGMEKKIIRKKWNVTKSNSTIGLTQLLWYFNDLEKQKCYSLPGGMPDWTKQGDACMKWRRFHNLFESSQSLFWAGFGMVGLEDFELTGTQEYTRFWSMLMFGSYSVINIIVLLNLLIAMMSNSYSFIVEHADTEWKFARTKLWMSYFEEGRTLPPPFNVLPNVKMFRKLFGSKKELDKARRMSTRTQRIKCQSRDYRYLGVMRALIWRYVCSLQRQTIENPVTEDDINEVKGDISSLRFELIDLFGHNGMDVSACSKKSTAALGRKMRIWERQLMRDFHVSPAMGADNASEPPPEPKNSMDSTAADRFRRIARLAMTAKVADGASFTGKNSASQIGRTNSHDDTGRETLKQAMDKARRKMEEDTPDGSPGSSRSCSPFPDLYTGPNLLDAINSLDLSPTASTSNTPQPKMKGNKNNDHRPDGQAKDHNLLQIPGRRSESSLKKENFSGDYRLDVSNGVFSVTSKKRVAEIKNSSDKCELGANGSIFMKPTDKEATPKATITSMSELDTIKVIRENKNSQGKYEENLNKIDILPKGDICKSKLLTNGNQVSAKPKMELYKNQRSNLGENDSALFRTTQIFQSPVDKTSPPQNLIKPTALRIEPTALVKSLETQKTEPLQSIVRPRPHGMIQEDIQGKLLAPSMNFSQISDQANLHQKDYVRKPILVTKQEKYRDNHDVGKRPFKLKVQYEETSNSTPETFIKAAAKPVQLCVKLTPKAVGHLTNIAELCAGHTTVPTEPGENSTIKSTESYNKYVPKLVEVCANLSLSSVKLCDQEASNQVELCSQYAPNQTESCHESKLKSIEFPGSFPEKLMNDQSMQPTSMPKKVTELSNFKSEEHGQDHIMALPPYITINPATPCPPQILQANKILLVPITVGKNQEQKTPKVSLLNSTDKTDTCGQLTENITQILDNEIRKQTPPENETKLQEATFKDEPPPKKLRNSEDSRSSKLEQRAEQTNKPDNLNENITQKKETESSTKSTSKVSQNKMFSNKEAGVTPMQFKKGKWL